MKTVSVFDRGLMYGDGLFETVFIYKGVPVLFDKHIQRLLLSMKFFDIHCPLTTENWRKNARNFLKKHKADFGLLRIMATRGIDKERKMGLYTSYNPNIILQYFPKKFINPLSRVMTLEVNKNWAPMPPPLPFHKLLNRLYAFHVKGLARKTSDEIAFVKNKRIVLEGSYSNIFIVKNKTLITPPVNDGILRGVTRDKIISLAKQSSIPVKETSIGLNDLSICNGLGLSFSSGGLVPVVNLVRCGKLLELKPHNIISLLQKKYWAWVERLYRDTKRQWT